LQLYFLGGWLCVHGLGRAQTHDRTGVEKSCRGTQPVVIDEYAWGNTSITAATMISGTEDGTEIITNADANCCFNYVTFTGGDGGQGPLRCGIFATGTSTRTKAGASYYGIMELSGNLSERCVTVADEYHSEITNAGLFNGSHGDGALSVNGHATNATWPGYSNGEVTSALGAGIRGSAWYSVQTEKLCVSNRSLAAYKYDSREIGSGIRGVRTAP